MYSKKKLTKKSIICEDREPISKIKGLKKSQKIILKFEKLFKKI